MHPGKNIPNFEQLILDHPHLASYDDKDHPVFSKATDAMQEGTPGAAGYFARLDESFASGNKFGVDDEEDELLLRVFCPEARETARKRGRKRSAAQIST